MEGSQEAELVTRLVLNGTVFMVKIAGQTATGAAKLLTFLAAAAKSEKTSGKEKLATLLKSGKPLQVFTFDEEQLNAFKAEAKRYGIVYSLVKRSEGDIDAGTYDVLCKSEDATRLNRILERMGIGTVDMPTLTGQQTEDRGEGTDLSAIRELINKMLQPDERSQNPHSAADTKDSLFAASSMVSDAPDNARPSVKKDIEGINNALSDVKDNGSDAGLLINKLLQADEKENELDEINDALNVLMGTLNKSDDKGRS